MAKLRGTDILTVLRGLNAVSKAAANVTEAELKEAWASSSTISALRNVNLRYKPEDLPQQVKEAAERSFAVVKGLKEFSLISAQNLVQKNFGQSDSTEFSQQGSQESFDPVPSPGEESSSLVQEMTPSLANSILNVNLDTNLGTDLKEDIKFEGRSTTNGVGTSESNNNVLSSEGSIVKSTNISEPQTLFPKSAFTIQQAIDETTPSAILNDQSTPNNEAEQTQSVSIDTKPSTTDSEPKSSNSPLQVQQRDEDSTNSPKEPILPPIPPVAIKNRKSKLSETSREVSVPSSRIGRLASYGSLAAGLGIGALAEITRRTLGLSDRKTTDENAPAILDSNPFLTEANAERIVNTLCKVRGAALKLGQMLSIQDNSLINPQLQKIFERVRQSADFMPARQMESVLVGELGSDWRSKLLDFQDKPFAAASVGQVHLATLLDGREVAMKIQYPGVAKGIESDINNLVSVMNVWNILPKGMYVEEFVEVAKRELNWEVDYIREAECTKRFKELVKEKPYFKVPDVIDELCSSQIFTSEFVEGISMEQCMELDQETRNYVAEKILSLCLMELFEFRFMQTDPNWANFMYNPTTRQVVLIDFGASREYSKEFVDKYIRVIEGAAEGDRQKVLEYSQALGFLAGYESKAMEEAHVDAVMILGEAFRFDKPFDFGKQDTTRRIQKLIPVMLSQRLCPPPQESYSLHRKMSGAFLLCAKLRANINCRPFFNEIVEKYRATGAL